MLASSRFASGLSPFWIAAVLLAIAAAGTWLWDCQRAQQELLELPVPERHTFYEYTLDTLRTVCAHANGPDLGDYCRKQARLIVRFPECDARCRDLARRFAPKPTR